MIKRCSPLDLPELYTRISEIQQTKIYKNLKTPKHVEIGKPFISHPFPAKKSYPVWGFFPPGEGGPCRGKIYASTPVLLPNVVR